MKSYRYIFFYVATILEIGLLHITIQKPVNEFLITVTKNQIWLEKCYMNKLTVYVYLFPYYRPISVPISHQNLLCIRHRILSPQCSISHSCQASLVSTTSNVLRNMNRQSANEHGHWYKQVDMPLVLATCQRKAHLLNKPVKLSCSR